MEYKSVKGMSDIFLPEIRVWQFIENEARVFFQKRLYEEIRTPVVEYQELFTRSIGEASDIVNKEMYSFTDRGGRALTLRPEMTASVIRAVIENNLLTVREPLKLFYIGPMFRAERPQAGRRRQFFQMGVEVIGNDLPFCDAEVIKDIALFLTRVGLKKEEFTVKLNNVGCATCRPDFVKKLRSFFQKNKAAFCKDCLFRFEKNVLRIFDCKNDACKKVLKKAPKINENVCPRCRDHFNKVQEGLQVFDVPFTVDKDIVRGLDYYTSTVFEVTSTKLGAKDAIAAGGRYNNLMKDLGGAAKSAIGFALGMERLIMCLDASAEEPQSAILSETVYVAYSDPKYIDACKQVCARLERIGCASYTDLDGRSLKSQLKRANKFGLRWVLILNKNEVEKGYYTLKDFCYKGEDQCLINIETMENQVTYWLKQWFQGGD